MWKFRFSRKTTSQQYHWKPIVIQNVVHQISPFAWGEPLLLYHSEETSLGRQADAIPPELEEAHQGTMSTRCSVWLPSTLQHPPYQAIDPVMKVSSEEAACISEEADSLVSKGVIVQKLSYKKRECFL